MKNALLVIDAQKIYTDVQNDYLVSGAETIVEKINKLIALFNKRDDLIIYIRHVNAADGSDSGRMYDFSGESGDVEFAEDTEVVKYSSELIIVKDAIHIIKTRYDSFINTNLNCILKQNNVEKVTIVGFMTNFCCDSTARTAHDLDYYVDFVCDATGTPDTENYTQNEIKNVICDTLSGGFATIVSTNELLR